ncbi:conserved Plasmodium protein, unknown function [Plasmodium ovale curtisi]|uniref:Methyltransferase n=1 Tax=Plasmodium ovale curtisi TaxID=864141 RepID=A0A1A8VZL3_PLAOA|nr:conserved Plasmodium protein, unknown function [Plasmodium ovale curtisi]SBS96240.1 conserved Plasmodium protein, unknown function [Plasmodium ovale curtisi]
MDEVDEGEQVYARGNNAENLQLGRKKKYSNLVTLGKKEVSTFNEKIMIEKKEQELLKMIPMLKEGTSCQLKKKSKNNFSNMDEISNEFMMKLYSSKTPSKQVEDVSENSQYIKTYSCPKKRVYTPSKFDKSMVFNYNLHEEHEDEENDEDEETSNKLSMFTTPKRRYTNKRKIGRIKNENNSHFSSKKKKKKSVYDELMFLHTPLREKNKYIPDEKEEHNYAGKDKWIMNESNMNELPEYIKNEYVSYLCSPLKRSERLIKSKINKMLNQNIENLKNEKEHKTKDSSKNNSSGCSDDDSCNTSETNQIAHCDFEPEEEERCWDDYYTQSVDKTRPFTGITTELAVSMISDLLKQRIKKIKIDDKEFFSPISENDTIMEIGHGNHPLAVQMYEKWGTVGRYMGVEFSGLASREALKCEKLKSLFLKRKVEFVKVLSMKYYKEDSLDGVVTQSNISPRNTKTDFIKLYTFKYIFAKSTLDYITCRMDNIGNSCDWEEDLQISPSVVEMFNSLSDSLQNSKNGNNKNNSTIIFVEPSNSSKFRDHILTIFKVIYTATFKYDSSAKYLRLCKITNNTKACGYMIEKRNEVYQNFEQMRQEFLKLILKSSITKNIDEVDWYLPTTAPQKWISNSPDDIEYLVNVELFFRSPASTERAQQKYTMPNNPKWEAICKEELFAALHIKYVPLMEKNFDRTV